MAINLSNVNISLQQFQEISSGKYNAGEVKLSSETGIDKVNNHVTLKFLNNVKISHEEVIAIKNAFIKALKSGGVKSEELNKIREELGLSPMKPVDTSLHQRSIKPLSRQKIREILDRNAITINNSMGNDTIRTSDQIYARVSDQTKASRKTERETVNSELDTRRDVVESKGIFNLQAVLAGDVDFGTSEERAEMLKAARKCLNAVLTGCGSKPRDIKANIVCKAPNDRSVVLSSGISEKELVRKLEDIIVRLAMMNKGPTNQELDFRDEFKGLDTQGERDLWVANLTRDPNGAFKARVIAVMIMQDHGIDDAATLSVVNKLNKDNLIAFLTNLTSNGMNLEGDAFRQSVPVQNALDNADPNLNVSTFERAYIPALTNDEFNTEINLNMVDHPERLPVTFSKLIDEASSELRTRFGTVGFPNNASSRILTRGKNLANIIGIHNPNALRITTESLRGPYLQEAINAGAERLLKEGIEKRLKRVGIQVINVSRIATAMQDRVPDLLERIIAAPSPEAADAVLNDFPNEIIESAKLLSISERHNNSLKGWAREALANKLGVSAKSFDNDSLNLRDLSNKGNSLKSDICTRNNKASTDAEIEAEYKKLANNFADERIQLFKKIDTANITAEAKSAIKSITLALEKVNYLDIDKMVKIAKSIPIDKLANLLATNAQKELIFDAMREISSAVNSETETTINKLRGGEDDKLGYSAVLIALVVLSQPKMEDNLVKFLADNVVGQTFTNQKNSAYPAMIFMRAFDPNTQANRDLASKLGTDAFPALHTQALMEALREEGLGDFSTAEMLELFNPNRPTGGSLLKTAIINSDRPITTVLLKKFARTALQACKPVIIEMRQNKAAVKTAEREFLEGNGAKSALAAGYHKSEFQRLAKTFALYKVATNASDAAALDAALDPTSNATRLMNYGGRFTLNAENFRAGLTLMGKFAQWYANLSADVADAKNLDTPTKVNAAKEFVGKKAIKGHEVFVFQDLAIRPDVNLDETDLEKLFGIEHNDVINFFSRGNGEGCTGTLMKLSPAKRQVVYAAFRAIKPPKAENNEETRSSLYNNVGYLARIIRHLDEVADLQATGKLDRAHLNKILTPDLNLPPDATSKQVKDAIDSRMYSQYAESQRKIAEVIFIMDRSGTTITEALNSVATGQKPAPLDDIASTTMSLEQIDGTTKGGRDIMLVDLNRLSNVSYIGINQSILAQENLYFIVNIGGETIQCARGFNKQSENSHIADKIENLCGKVHVEQANAVMRGLGAGAHFPLVATLTQYGIAGSEHMPLTYTISKNDETGAVTIRYSEPKGFPFKFHWETTIDLDGTSTLTPITVMDVPKDFPGYRKLAGGTSSEIFTSNTIAPGNGRAAKAFRQMVETRSGAPEDALPPEKAKAFANKVNVRGAKNMAFKFALVASNNIVKNNGNIKTMDVNSVHKQFNRDLKGDFKFFYPGVEGTSKDYNTNRDNLVRFVTKDNNATFETATEATKRKVSILMSMMTQYTSSLVSETLSGALALPGSQNGFFAPGAFSAQPTNQEFHLSMDDNGNIKIIMNNRDSVNSLTVYGENDTVLSTDKVKPGSYYEYEMEIVISADNLETLANADWTKYDSDTINKYRGDNIDERNALIPEQYRFKGDVNISYHIQMNED